DEPTGNLDDKVAEDTMRLFLRIHESGTTILFATHDARLLKRFHYRVISLQQGRLVGDSRSVHEEFTL
ncbi:MAG: cell division ATP-binding protein FtsE, partial [Candidatus Binatia bacterium]